MDLRKAVKDIFPRIYDEDVDLYIAECERRKVDPMSRLIVPRPNRKKDDRGYWVRGGPPAWITTIDLMRARADETGTYAPGRETEYEYVSGDTLVSAKAFVKKFVQGQCIEFSESARWDEFYPGDGIEGTMWRKMPEVMLGKTAEARALRRGWPAQLAGLYESAEMDQSAEHVETHHPPKAATGNVRVPEETKDSVETAKANAKAAIGKARYDAAMTALDNAMAVENVVKIGEFAKTLHVEGIFDDDQHEEITTYCKLLANMMNSTDHQEVDSIAINVSSALAAGVLTQAHADRITKHGVGLKKMLDSEEQKVPY